MASNTGVVDNETIRLIDSILKNKGKKTPDSETKRIKKLYNLAVRSKKTNPLIKLFEELLRIKSDGRDCSSIGISKDDLLNLSKLHSKIDEYGVTVSARLSARKDVMKAVSRIEPYLKHKKDVLSGIELGKKISKNQEKIMRYFSSDGSDWKSFSWQMKNRINDAITLGNILDLPKKKIKEIGEVQRKYRMSITPYYASLIMKENPHDPVLIQSVPDIKEVRNQGQCVSSFSARHSPARIVDQIYPQTAIIKVSNVCAMYCRHCLRVHDIGFKDKYWSDETFEEAFEYVRDNKNIRDLLLTGGDMLSLSNKRIDWILGKLTSIEHVKTLRLGTRMVVTVPQRIDNNLLSVLRKYNKKKPIRMPVQINCAQEITEDSMKVLHDISDIGVKLMCQSVFLKGVNDSEVKMWKLLETLQEAKVRPYYLFNCSFRDTQFKHLRVPIEVGRRIIRGTIANLSGDIRPTYIATAEGKIPLHEDYLIKEKGKNLVLKRPWNGELVEYPDAEK
ncbi:MAG: KamA family radical SAM protein [Nanoarchaeota archaeon]|nr:KamA family radical SAM protein [Nanoarchaeota archaeon]